MSVKCPNCGSDEFFPITFDDPKIKGSKYGEKISTYKFLILDLDKIIEIIGIKSKESNWVWRKCIWCNDPKDIRYGFDDPTNIFGPSKFICEDCLIKAIELIEKNENSINLDNICKALERSNPNIKFF